MVFKPIHPFITGIPQGTTLGPELRPFGINPGGFYQGPDADPVVNLRENLKSLEALDPRLAEGARQKITASLRYLGVSEQVLALPEHLRQGHQNQWSGHLANVVARLREDHFQALPQLVGFLDQTVGLPGGFELVARRFGAEAPLVPVPSLTPSSVSQGTAAMSAATTTAESQNLARAIRAGGLTVNTEEEMARREEQAQEIIRAGTSRLPDSSRLSVFPSWFRSTLVVIPPGDFRMGSENGGTNERPLHRVIVPAFYMMNVALTNEMYERIMERKSLSPKSFDGSRQPVVNFSYEDQLELASKLTDYSHGELIVSLATEARWEWAARGGRDQNYAIDPNASTILPRYANYYDSKIDKTTSVGTYLANGFGLFDMSGNVWELCLDWYSAVYYAECESQGLVIDPQGPQRGQSRVARGGSWRSQSYYARSAHRFNSVTSFRNNNIGARFMVSPRTS